MKAPIGVRKLQVRSLGQIDYATCWEAMRCYTDARGPEWPDEIWLLEHPPTYTQGQAGRAEHLLNPGDIPVIQVDRGGQVTYHGPGQLVAYLLVDLRRWGLGVRALVDAIEQSIVAVLRELGIAAGPRPGAPGVYLADGAKIAALGLRVRRGCSFHGLAFNLDLDLEPFARINPCGYAGLQVARLCDHVGHWDEGERRRVEGALVRQLATHLGYTEWRVRQGLPGAARPGGLAGD